MTRTKPPKTMDNQLHIKQLIKSHEGLIEVLQKDLQKLKEMEPSTPEPKEPETWKELVKFNGIIFQESREEIIDTNFHDYAFELDRSTDERSTEISNFIKRLLIADYCGRREFTSGQDNWFHYYRVDVDKWEASSAIATIQYGVFYFPTKEAAEKYLKICQNSNLL